MKTAEICKISFLNSLLVLIYIIPVAYLMMHGNSIFGQVNSIIAIITFLLLFSLSALVVGGLILGKPIMLYLDGKKKEAVLMLVSTGGWLALYVMLAMIYLALK